MRALSLVGLLALASPAFAASTDTANGVSQSSSTTTGNGWIDAPKGGKGSFEIRGRLKADGTLSGRVLYSDNKLNFTMEGTGLTAFVPGCKSTLSGTAASNLGPVQFVVIATDSGHDGVADDFSITLTGAVSYAASGKLGGGKINAHRHCP
jgi:hypothetical protein